VFVAGIGRKVKMCTPVGLGVSTITRSRAPGRIATLNGRICRRTYVGWRGYERFDVLGLEVVERHERGGARGVERSVLGAQPTALDVQLLAIGEHLGDRRLQIGVAPATRLEMLTLHSGSTFFPPAGS
jgi:hypothetical protein